MERVIEMTGFGVFVFCLMAMFVIGNTWAWGCGIGLILTLFGMYFGE